MTTYFPPGKKRGGVRRKRSEPAKGLCFQMAGKKGDSPSDVRKRRYCKREKK